MTDKLEFNGYVKGGKMFIRNRHDFDKSIKMFEGKQIEIVVQKKRNVRSLQQNRLWWLYVTIISESLGYEKDEMHDILKFKFLKRERVVESTGEIIPYLESTTRLTRSEFSNVVDAVIRWAAEMDIVLPEPNHQLSF